MKEWDQGMKGRINPEKKWVYLDYFLPAFKVLP